MPRAIAINPGRGGLHTETSARRKYWRRGIVAGDRGKPGFTSQETASVASPKCQDSVTNSSFGNDGTEGGRSDCCKLWTKSANRGITSYRGRRNRSEEHTSELQSRLHLVCRLLL